MSAVRAHKDMQNFQYVAALDYEGIFNLVKEATGNEETAAKVAGEVWNVRRRNAHQSGQ